MSTATVDLKSPHRRLPTEHVPAMTGDVLRHIAFSLCRGQRSCCRPQVVFAVAVFAEYCHHFARANIVLHTALNASTAACSLSSKAIAG